MYMNSPTGQPTLTGPLGPPAGDRAPSLKPTVIRRILRAVAVLAALGVLGIIVLLGSLRLEHTFSTSLPTPTGTFGVGRAIYDWVDAKTVDSLAAVPGTNRELLVWVWYPSSTRQAVAIDDSFPVPMRAGIERARRPGSPL